MSNVAPKHYGVSTGRIHDPVRDANQTKYYDRFEDVWCCTTMTWYIEKGDDLLRARKIEFPFYEAFEPNPSNAELQITSYLMECSLDKAPDHPKHGKLCREQ